MARARELHAVELKPTAITVEGREEDLTALANRLEQLRRLCR